MCTHDTSAQPAILPVVLLHGLFMYIFRVDVKENELSAMHCQNNSSNVSLFFSFLSSNVLV